MSIGLTNYATTETKSCESCGSIESCGSVGSSGSIESSENDFNNNNREGKVQEVVRAEHDLSHLSVCGLGSKELVQYFGRGVNSYFRFVKLLGISNILLFLLTTGFIVVHGCLASGNSVKCDIQWNDFLFLQLQLRTDTTSLTLSYSLLGIVCLLLLIIILIFYRSSRYNTNTNNSSGVDADEWQGAGLVPENNDPVTKCLRLKTWMSVPVLKLFRVFLTLMFAVLFVCYYYCQRALRILVGPPRSTAEGVGYEVLLSLIFVIMEFLWRIACHTLTSLEGHKYLLSHQYSDCLKSYFSRIIIFSIYASATATTSNGGSPTSAATEKYDPNNGYGGLAPQMLSLIVVNTALSPFIDLFVAQIYFRCCYFVCCGQESKSADGNYKAKFNLADEYTQLLFRQYLINQCLLFVPLAPLVGAIGCALEFYTDQYKLLRLSNVPERHGSSFRRIIIAFLCVNLLAVLFAYPNGYFW